MEIMHDDTPIHFFFAGTFIFTEWQRNKFTFFASVAFSILFSTSKLISFCVVSRIKFNVFFFSNPPFLFENDFLMSFSVFTVCFASANTCSTSSYVAISSRFLSYSLWSQVPSLYTFLILSSASLAFSLTYLSLSSIVLVTISRRICFSLDRTGSIYWLNQENCTR